MDSQPVIVARGLTKSYRIWREPSQRLLGPIFAEAAAWLPGAAGTALQQRAHAAYRDFHAIENVDFEVNRGEAVGIVGRNGAGKSTLLQMIAGTLQPTAGTIEVRGRVAALLELGAGFNPEFTGRENVFLSGAVLGLTKAEMEARFDAVAAFADIGDFIEQPVKTYSSGMMMRLAFAVNTCVDPEILIVDEALSVGDAPFQAKCFRRLRQLIDQGVSLLFVSHDLGTVRSICSRALWLKGGRAEMWGEAKVVAKEYEKFCWAEQGVALNASVTSPPADATPAPATDAPPEIPPAGPWELLQRTNHLLPATPETRLGNQAIEFVSIVATGADGQPRREFDYDETITLHYHLRARVAVDSDYVLGVRLRNVQGLHVLSAQHLTGMQRIKLAARTEAYASVTLRLPLAHGDYVVRTGIFGFRDGQSRENGSYDFTRAIFWDIREEALVIRVRPFPAMPLPGPVQQHATTRLIAVAQLDTDWISHIPPPPPLV